MSCRVQNATHPRDPGQPPPRTSPPAQTCGRSAQRLPAGRRRVQRSRARGRSTGQRRAGRSCATRFRSREA
ncbi:hypothetical protein ACFPRL_09325 [Pseudoclavibacter helvolus]